MMRQILLVKCLLRKVLLPHPLPMCVLVLRHGIDLDVERFAWILVLEVQAWSRAIVEWRGLDRVLVVVVPGWPRMSYVVVDGDGLGFEVLSIELVIANP
jgi:hypothetical protein